MRRLIPILLAAAAACHAAAVLDVAFNPQMQTGGPGQLIQFFGTLTNNTGSTVFLNSDSIGFPLVVDDTPFFINAPLFLGAFETTGLIELLEVTIPLAQLPGTYDGSFTVLGGSLDSDSLNIGTGSFQLTVESGVPEPGSMLLMAGGVASLVWRRQRRRR